MVYEYLEFNVFVFDLESFHWSLCNDVIDVGESEINDYLPDFNMDLLRALEMSRIQFLFEAERAYSIDVNDT